MLRWCEVEGGGWRVEGLAVVAADCAATDDDTAAVKYVCVNVIIMVCMVTAKRLPTAQYSVRS